MINPDLLLIHFFLRKIHKHARLNGHSHTNTNTIFCQCIIFKKKMPYCIKSLYALTPNLHPAGTFSVAYKQATLSPSHTYSHSILQTLLTQASDSHNSLA